MSASRRHGRVLVVVQVLASFLLPVAAQSEPNVDQHSPVAHGSAHRVTPKDGLDSPLPSGGRGPSRAQLESLIDRTASRFGVERALARAVVAAESAYNAKAVSRAGAVGLMQVMPATAADYGITRADALFDPQVNLSTGMRHLRRLLNKYGNDYGRVIMAYNAGEGVVDRTNNNVTYAETLNYTETVIRHYRKNGGVQLLDQTLRKVASLRRRTGSTYRAHASAPSSPHSLSLKKPTGATGQLDSSLYPELADGYLDSALEFDVTDGDFEILP